MLRGYKYRIYPNKAQEVLIQKTFGCCRFVYNHVLAYREMLYEQTKVTMDKFSCNNYVNQVLKKEYEWLKEADSFALTNSIFNMDNAYKKFFKEHIGFPKFKSKKTNKKSYTTNISKNNIEVNFENNKIKLPKLKWLSAKLHREFTGRIKSATISQVPSGKYFVSILVDEDCIPIDSTGQAVGVDLGIKDLIVTSDGIKFDNIHTTKKYADMLAKAQRKLSHKVAGSANYEKQRIKVAKIYEKIHNTRVDYLHKISHKLISENQVIVSEDLSVSNLIKNHHLAKAIQDCSWYELTRQLEYKASWNNRQYIKIDRFFKSSQSCSVCGYINPDVKNLAVRSWCCPMCGRLHDRDLNAAVNILSEGLRLLSVT